VLNDERGIHNANSAVLKKGSTKCYFKTVRGFESVAVVGSDVRKKKPKFGIYHNCLHKLVSYVHKLDT
jgi:hypothetical protein